MQPSPFIETATGRRFQPLDPVLADIRILDIAHSLAQQCRFNGHTRVHYSVAEHSVRVANLLERWGEPREVVLWGLLHDASEAYLTDVPSPLKKHLTFAAYMRAEERLMHAICIRFNLPVDQPLVIRQADEMLLATEARDLMPFRPEHWKDLTAPLAETIDPWTAVQAEQNFLRKFAELVT